jgi:hypothetical protein
LPPLVERIDVADRLDCRKDIANHGLVERPRGRKQRTRAAHDLDARGDFDVGVGFDEPLEPRVHALG